MLTRGLLAASGVEAPLADVTERFEAAYQGEPSVPGLRRHESLIPRADLLRTLSGDYALGVVTGRPRGDAERFLLEAGVRDLFGAVVCREDAPLKPDPAPVHTALRALQVDSAWLLGDTPDDVVAARSAGVVPVGVVAPGGSDAERQALESAGAARIIQANDDLGGLFS